MNNYYTKSPCYKCEQRTAECKIVCEKWKSYETLHEIEREEFYRIRKGEVDSKSLMLQSEWKQKSKISQKGVKRKWMN